MNLIEELSWRNLIKDISNETKICQAQKEKRGVYCGFDPTAPSLHVGHLIPLTMLERCRQAGLKPIAVIGGATGMIGDPSYKSQERVLLSAETVHQNTLRLEKQIKKILPYVGVVNNKNWLSSFPFLDYLREVGKDFNLAYLLGKETIQNRIQSGLSVTEFLYTTLQAYDFYHLYQEANCRLQIGGSDQWGNLTSGLDYIASKLGNQNVQAAALTVPLLIKKDGEKFGKTAAGAIWLDPEKTSEFQFYQFWLQQPDDQVVTLLKYFTFLNGEEIEKLIALDRTQPQKRLLQQKLAQEVTFFVHGNEGLKKAEILTQAFFQGTIDQLTPELLQLAINSLPHANVDLESTVGEVLLATKTVTSKREAKEFITQKSLQINGVLVKDLETKMTKFPLLNDKYFLIKKGKKSYGVGLIKS